MGEVIDIGSRLPHCVVQDENNNIHVFPVALIEDWSTGKQEIPEDKDTKAILRVILLEWLEGHGYRRR